MLNSANAEGIVHRGEVAGRLSYSDRCASGTGLASNAHAGDPAEEQVAVAICQVTVSDSSDPCNIPSATDSGDYCHPCEIMNTTDRTTADAEGETVCKTAYPKWEQKTEWRVKKGVRDREGEFVEEQRIKLFYGATYGISLQKKVTDTYSVHGEIHIPLGQFYKEDVQRGRVTIQDVIILKNPIPDGDPIRVYPEITGDSPACTNPAPDGGSGEGAVLSRASSASTGRTYRWAIRQEQGQDRRLRAVRGRGGIQVPRHAYSRGRT